MKSQEKANKPTEIFRILQVKRKFMPSRKSLEVIQNLIRAHGETA